MTKKELQEIITNIFPVYQGIVDFKESNINENKYKIVKYEALIRSKLNSKILYPNELFDFKIDKKDFTKQMFKKVIEDIKKYKIDVSFNINLSDIENEELRIYILQEINKNIQISPSQNKKIAEYFTFEFVEEEEIMKNIKLVNDFIDKVHELGGKIALDDFGKGYATFGPLIKFNFDIIKFDEILVKDFLQHPIKYYLLNTLIEMFNKLGKKVVVEYIETTEEFNTAKFIGCHYGQGFCIAKPQKIDNYLNNQNKIERNC
jgi:EAL domain-containing protein (putative c-di-GMP-specific phosphodiesterase class I)